MSNRKRVYRVEFKPNSVEEFTDEQLRAYIASALRSQGLDGFCVIKQLSRRRTNLVIKDEAPPESSN